MKYKYNGKLLAVLSVPALAAVLNIGTDTAFAAENQPTADATTDPATTQPATVTPAQPAVTDDREVTYEFKSTDDSKELPEEIKNKTIREFNKKGKVGKKINLDKPYPSRVTDDKTKTKWEFKGYESNAHIENSSFWGIVRYNYTIQDGENKVVQLWEPKQLYSVKYEFANNDTLPENIKAQLPNERVVENGQPVSPATIANVKLEENGRSYLYKLTWNENSKVIESSDFTFVGTWTKEELYDVKYELTSADVTITDEMRAQLPEVKKGQENGAVITAPTLTKINGEENGKDVIYNIAWNKSHHTIANADFTFVGTVTKENAFRVKYDFSSADPNKTLPNSVLEVAKKLEKTHLTNGTEITLETNIADVGSDNAEKGMWHFDGFDNQTKTVTINDQDVTVSGKWSFTPANFNVTIKFKRLYKGEASIPVEEEEKKYTSSEEEIGLPKNHPDGGWRHLYKNFIGWTDKEPVNDLGELPEGAKVFLATDKISQAFPNGLTSESTLYPVYIGGQGSLTGSTIAQGFQLLGLKGALFNKINDNKIVIADKDVLPNTENEKILDNGKERTPVKTIDIIDWYKKDTLNEVVLSSEFSMNKSVALLVYSNPEGANGTGNVFQPNTYNWGDTGHFAPNLNADDYTYMDLKVDIDEGIDVPETLYLGFKGYSWRPIYVLDKEGNALTIVKPTDGSELGNDKNSFNDLISTTDPVVNFGVKTNGKKEFIVRVIIRLDKGNTDRPIDARIKEANVQATADKSKADIVSENMKLWIHSKEQLKTLLTGKTEEQLKEAVLKISEEKAKELARTRVENTVNNATNKDVLEVMGNAHGSITPIAFNLPIVGNIFAGAVRINNVESNLINIGFNADVITFDENLGTTPKQTKEIVEHNSSIKDDTFKSLTDNKKDNTIPSMETTLKDTTVKLTVGENLDKKDVYVTFDENGKITEIKDKKGTDIIDVDLFNGKKVVYNGSELSLRNVNQLSAWVNGEKDNQVISIAKIIEKDGKKYKFKGWNTKQDGSGVEFTEETTVSSPVTVYAIWEEITEDVKTYKVEYVFESKDKTIKLPKEVLDLLPQGVSDLAKDSAYTPIALTKESVKVEGGVWKLVKKWDADAVKVTHNLTFTAIWEFTKDTVKPNPNVDPKPDQPNQDPNTNTDPKSDQPNQDPNTNTDPKSDQPKFNTKPVLAKTGATTNSSIFLGLLALISAVVLRRNKKN